MLRASLDSAPGGLLLVGAEGEVAYVNAALKDIWSLSDQELPSDAAKLLAQLDGLLAEDATGKISDIDPEIGLRTVKLRDGRWLVARTWLVMPDDPVSSQFWQFHEVAENLRVSDERLSDFADVASDYFWETGPDDRFSYVSDRYPDITGVRAADVLGKTRTEVWAEYGQSDSAINTEYGARVAEKVAKREPISDMRVEWRRSDGQDLVLSVSGKPMFEPDGAYAGYRGVGSIVTKYVRHEEDLRDSEKRLRALLEASPIGVSVVSKETNQRLFVNKAFSDMMAASPGELIGGKARDAWADAVERDPMMRLLERAEQVVDLESRRRRLDGSEFWALMNSRDVDFAGTPARMYWIMDITARRETERILRASERRFREILEDSPIPFSVVSINRKKRQFVNRAFVEMMRAESAEPLLNDDLADTWVNPEELITLRDTDGARTDHVDLECWRKRLDGEEFPALINSRRVDFGGEPARVFWIIDLTERMKAEEATRRSEERLRAILESSPVGFIVSSPKTGKRVFVNSAAVEIFGAETPEQMLAVPIVDTWVEESAFQRSREILDKGDDLHNFEALRRRHDGSNFSALLNSRNIEFEGEPAVVIWITDISDRVRAEEVVRQSENRLRAVFGASPIGFAVVERDSNRRIFVNQAIVDMFGVASPDEFINQPVPDSWADPSQLSALQERMNAGEEVVNFEATRLRADGSRFTALMNTRNTVFEGEPARVLWLTDISDRVNAENVVRENEAKLREILEDSPIGISVVSQQTDRRLFANTRMAELFGAEDAQQLVGMEMRHSWTDEEDLRRTQDLMATGLDLTNYEVRRKRVDGEEFWVLLNSQNIEFEGEHARVIWHHEITEIRRQQDQLQAAMEIADTANRAKSEFLSSMSHELRTPLNSILGFAQIMQLDEVDPLNDRQENSVEQIMRGGHHLLELIDRVLDLAKIEAGNLEFDVERMALGELLAECRDMVLSTAEESRISVEILRVAETDPLEVLVDQTALRQIILNLLSNAIKYNRAGGRVEISRKVTAMGMLRLAITDTGIGISPEYWDAVFEPFSRLGRESSEIEGTGIGLTLSQRLAEQMGGGIGFTSEPGVGSTFWIDLPIAREVPSGATGEGAADDLDLSLSGGAEGVVLYVEDNPANMQLVKLIFEHLDGLKLIPATNAEIGLELAHTHLPDVILMDIRLPGIDGYEALRRLQADPVTASIPVIALSADAMPDNIDRGRAAGFYDYLTKPLDVAQVIGAINRALTRTRLDG